MGYVVLFVVFELGAFGLVECAFDFSVVWGLRKAQATAAQNPVVGAPTRTKETVRAVNDGFFVQERDHQLDRSWIIHIGGLPQ